MKTRSLMLVAVCVAASLVRAAAASNTNDPAATDAFASMAALDDHQKLRPGDRVTYRVLEDKDEPRSLTITDSGELEVPYYGLVPAAGKTSRQLAQEIKRLLEQKLYHQATVIIAVELVNRTRSTGKVYVNGRVRNPGVFDIPPGESLTVSKAILLAGGFSDFADKRRVQLTRQTAAGPETLVVNVQQVWEKGQLEKDPAVQPNDRIFVDQRLVNF